MKFLNKLKNANFWISLISAGVLVAQSVFDFEIKTEYLNQILLGIMGILTMFGIVSDHGTNSSELEIKNTATSTDSTNSNIKSICDTITLLLNKALIKVGEGTSEQLEQLLNILTNAKDGEEIKNVAEKENKGIQKNDTSIEENQENLLNENISIEEEQVYEDRQAGGFVKNDNIVDVADNEIAETPEQKDNSKENITSIVNS